MKRFIALLLFMSTFSSLYAEDPWCKVSTTASKNQGYCVEGIDGTGKCLKLEVEGAPKCSDDQPITVE